MEKKMKAAVIESVNNMNLKDVPVPILKQGECLIKVKYSGICGTDVHILNGAYKTDEFPIIPGHEFVGELVEICGDNPNGIAVGDIVTAQEIVSCGSCEACAKGADNVCSNLKIVGIQQGGSFAEYVKVLTRKTYKIPDDIDLLISSLIEPLAVAVHDVRRSDLNVGETALVSGGGTIGLLIALVARAAGAGMVVISEVSEYRKSFAEKMGFLVVNPLDPDYENQLKKITEGKGFNVSFEASGAKNALGNCIEYTKSTGSVMIVGIPAEMEPLDINKIFKKELRLQGVRMHSQYNYLGAIEMIKSGIISNEISMLISKVYDFDQVGEAFKAALNREDYYKVLVRIL